jgi:bifunctional non-homologous end joining protein LigD
MTSVEVDGRQVALTNLEKVLFPATGFTKAQLIEYYVAVAPVLLPHLAGRPLTLRRFPDGIGGVSWHQNEIQREPPWFPVFETAGRGGRILRFALVDALAPLVWLANAAAVELHPFLWRTDAPRVATQLVLDLDPGPPAGLRECAQVALAARELLEAEGLAPLAKTSGSLGIHVHAPVEPGLDTKTLAHELAAILAAEHPGLVVATVRKAERAGRVYVDWLQNDPTRQTVAPYSLRGTPVPQVATPVTWEEVEGAAAGAPLGFGPDAVLERIARDGDLAAPLLG